MTGASHDWDGWQSPTPEELEIDRLRLEVSELTSLADAREVEVDRLRRLVTAAADALDAVRSGAVARGFLRAVLDQRGAAMTALLPDRDRLGYYRRAVLRAQVEATPLDPMGRHRHCPFCRAPLDHHHEGRPRRTCSARACALKWRAVTRPPRAGEYAAKRERRALSRSSRIGTAKPGAKP